MCGWFSTSTFTETFAASASPPPSLACWVGCIVVVPPSASKQLAALVRIVGKKLPVINFGINLLAARGSFNAQGQYKTPPGSDGLTCATFVIEIFRAASMHLIDEGTWRPRLVHFKWVWNVCLTLASLRNPDESTAVDVAHIELVRKSGNGVRVLPEEVGAAVDTECKLWPIAFDVASAGAAAVMDCLRASCPRNLRSQIKQQFRAISAQYEWSRAIFIAAMASYLE